MRKETLPQNSNGEIDKKSPVKVRKISSIVIALEKIGYFTKIGTTSSEVMKKITISKN